METLPYGIKRLANGDLQADTMGSPVLLPQHRKGLDGSPSLGHTNDACYAAGRVWRRKHPQPFDEPPPAQEETHDRWACADDCCHPSHRH